VNILSFLATLSIACAAQGLPGNFESVVVADSAQGYVVNYQSQMTRIRFGGDSVGGYTTWESNLSTANQSADIPVWLPLARSGRTLFPLATLDANRKGMLSGFFRVTRDSAKSIAGMNLQGTTRPMPTQWTLDSDTSWGIGDSSRVMWRLDPNDSLSAFGFSGTSGLVHLLDCGGCDLAKTQPGFKLDTFSILRGIARDNSSKALWLATPAGLWNIAGGTKTLRDSSIGIGVWAGNKAILYRSIRGLNWADSAGGKFKAVTGDTSALAGNSISSVAWLGDTAWIVMHRNGIGLAGILRIWKGQILSGSGKTPSLLNAEDGLPFTTDVNLSAVAIESATGRIWISSRGEGLAVSSNAGRTWRLIRHQAALRKNLLEVRVSPTRLEYGSALVGYSLDQGGNVDIDIFNGAMEPVRSLTRSANRPAGLRSEDPLQDRWNGCTDKGKLAAIGLYYVRVRSGNQTAWGKVFQLKGGNSCGN
jgi:hypothetical protein